MYTVLLKSTSTESVYTLGEFEMKECDVIEYLSSDPVLSNCIKPFLPLFHITFNDETESVLLHINQDTPCIYIAQTNTVNYYRIPFFESFTEDDYFKYFAMLYTCANSHSLLQLPVGTFNPYVFDSVMQSDFKVDFDEKRDGTDRTIYPCTTWLLEETDEHVYLFRVEQQHG
jgi:hypothetical protein